MSDLSSNAACINLLIRQINIEGLIKSICDDGLWFELLDTSGSMDAKNCLRSVTQGRPDPYSDGILRMGFMFLFHLVNFYEFVKKY